MRSYISMFVLSSFVFLTTTFASAQEVVGTITGTLDGEDRVWFITAMGGNSSSYRSEMGPITNVTIFGHASDDTIMSAKDALIIDFSLMNGEVFPDTLSVAFSDSSVEGNYYANNDNVATLTLTRIADENGQLTLEGAFTATMAYGASYGAPLDPENTRAAEGTFSLTLSPRS